jgi:hypothetical protein
MMGNIKEETIKENRPWGRIRAVELLEMLKAQVR